MSRMDDLRHLLGTVFDSIATHDEAMVSRREEFVFHMMDWIEDGEALMSLYRDPGRWEAKKAASLVYGFLARVVPHLRRATDLLDGPVNPPSESR